MSSLFLKPIRATSGRKLKKNERVSL